MHLNSPYTIPGFQFRTQASISERKKIESIFNALCIKNGSEPIEVPLVSASDLFLGEAPKVLAEKNSERLLKGHTPYGKSIAVRYEGTILTALYAAQAMKQDPQFTPRAYHYFQEMVRLEHSNALDQTHLRAFYQAGVEMFANSEIEQQQNFLKLIQIILRFLQKIGQQVRFRISHMDIVNKPLAHTKLTDHDNRKIVGYLEHHNIKDLNSLLSRVSIPKKIQAILSELCALGVCSLERGINWMQTHPEFYTPVVQKLKILRSQLSTSDQEQCFFDGGIHRSLNFYSGLIFQCDIDNILECAGGGEYDNIMSLFGIKDVHCLGLAFGVERLMQNNKS